MLLSLFSWPVILLYDSACGFCMWMVSQILRHDTRGAITAVPIQSPRGDELLADLDPELRLASFHAVAGDRRTSGGDAFVPVLRAVPRLAPLARVVSLVPLPVLRAGYGFVARHRSTISRLVPARSKHAARARLAG